MSSTVTLQNASKRMLEIALDHPSAPRVPHTHIQHSRDPKSGKRGARIQELKLTDSIILPVGGSRSGLPGWVAEVPDVQAMANANPPFLRVTVEAADAKQKAARGAVERKAQIEKMRARRAAAEEASK